MKKRMMVINIVLVFICTGLIGCTNSQNESTTSFTVKATDATVEKITEVTTTVSENGDSENNTIENPEHIDTAASISYRPVDSDVEWGVTVQYSERGVEVLCTCPPSTMISGSYKSGKASGKADVCSAFDLGGDVDSVGASLEMEVHINGDYLTLTVVEPDKPENVRYWAKELKFVRG